MKTRKARFREQAQAHHFLMDQEVGEEAGPACALAPGFRSSRGHAGPGVETRQQCPLAFRHTHTEGLGSEESQLEPP